MPGKRQAVTVSGQFPDDTFPTSVTFEGIPSGGKIVFCVIAGQPMVRYEYIEEIGWVIDRNERNA